MKFCNYTNFDALFPSVVTDFPFHRLNQYFKIAKFVYRQNGLPEFILCIFDFYLDYLF